MQYRTNDHQYLDGFPRVPISCRHSLNFLDKSSGMGTLFMKLYYETKKASMKTCTHTHPTKQQKTDKDVLKLKVDKKWKFLMGWLAIISTAKNSYSRNS